MTPYTQFLKLKSASFSGCVSGKFYLLIIGRNGSGDNGSNPNPTGCNVLWSTSGITGDGSARGYWYFYMVQATGSTIASNVGGSAAGHSDQLWEFA